MWQSLLLSGDQEDCKHYFHVRLRTYGPPLEYGCAEPPGWHGHQAPVLEASRIRHYLEVEGAAMSARKTYSLSHGHHEIVQKNKEREKNVVGRKIYTRARNNHVGR